MLSWVIIEDASRLGYDFVEENPWIPTTEAASSTKTSVAVYLSTLWHIPKIRSSLYYVWGNNPSLLQESYEVYE
jgi:hypothetical protein